MRVQIEMLRSRRVLRLAFLGAVTQLAILQGVVLADEVVDIPTTEIADKTVDGVHVKPVDPIEVWTDRPSAYTGTFFNRKLQPLAPDTTFKIESYARTGSPLSKKLWGKVVPIDPVAPSARPCVSADCWIVLGKRPPNSPFAGPPNGGFKINPKLKILGGKELF